MYLFLISGFLIITTGTIILREVQKRKNLELIQRSITHLKQEDFLLLEEQQIELSREEKLQMLIHCCDITPSKPGIDYLKKTKFKPYLEEVIKHCPFDRKNVSLRFVFTHFSDPLFNTILLKDKISLHSLIQELLANEVD